MRSFLRALPLLGLTACGIAASTIPLACGGADTSGTGGDVPIDAGDDTSPDGDNDNPVCGNGIVEGVEQCDDGNSTNGDGCQNDCTLTCKPGPDGDKQCNDGNACNGVETCDAAAHKCNSGAALSDGAACGTGKLCKAGLCIDSSCGDGVVTAPEECDDGNAVNGDGCDNCRFSCVSTDTMRNCTPVDPCAGTATCDDTKHTCGTATPLADGTSCGTDKVCKAGACVAGSCGDGVVTGMEKCDFGSGNGPGTGCEVDCTFSCSTTADTCSDGNPCNGTESCQTVMVSGHTGQKCAAGTPLGDGTACGTGLACKAGFCVSANCGNGVIDSGEDCDWGSANAAGAGCEPTCKFSCTKAPDSCPDSNPCNGVEACQTVTSSTGKTGQKCAAGTPLAACAACGTGGVCVSGTCKTSTCGDGCIDSVKGETCDPPAASTCDGFCHKITAPVCGNGVQETGETCDDGAKLNLDGCSGTCAFEQDQRANAVAMQWSPSTFCPKNALGGAIGGLAQGQITTALNTGVKDGSISIMFEFLGMTDYTGTAGTVKLGSITGKPVAAPTGLTYDGTNALDWWYTADATAIDASRLPTAQLAAAISGHTLTTPTHGTMTLILPLSGTPAPLHLSDVNVTATTDAMSVGKPTTSTSGNTPGHLASEHVDPALTTFGTMSNGQLCGNVSAASLRAIKAPAAIAGTADSSPTINCNQAYKPTSTMLDVIVGGCTVVIIPAITATQPDKTDPSMPVAGAGGPYKLVATGKPPVVTSCQDSKGTTVDLNTCLNAAAYSSYFTFTTQRVIIK